MKVALKYTPHLNMYVSHLVYKKFHHGREK